jgi:hypothetical protein
MYRFSRNIYCLLIFLNLYLFHYQLFARTQEKCGTLLWKGGALNDTENWFNATNWQPTMVPDEFQDVVIDNSSTFNCVISGARKARCHGLVLNSHSLFINAANDSLEISGNLRFAGGILDMTKGGVLKLYKDWTDDWINNGFIPGTSEVLWCGNAIQTIRSNNKLYFYDFIMQAVRVELKTAIEVSGKLSLIKGFLITTYKTNQPYLLTLDTHATLGEIGFEGTGGSSQSFVSGPMEWRVQDTGMHYFPVGNGSYYAPIGVIPQDNSPKIYRAQYYSQGFGLYNITPPDTFFMSRICANEYWTLLPFPITGTTITNDQAKVRLHWRYKTGFPYIGDRKDVFVARYASDSWSLEGYTPWVDDQGPQWGTVQSDVRVSGYGSFTFGSKAGLIPVNIINFEGSVTDVFEIGLKWQMGEYGKTRQFLVERSIDETSFSTIGVLDSSMLVNVNSIYEFMDKFPVEGYNYYRIKQIDVNGAHNYSQTIAIFLELGGFPQISAMYPNPVQNVLNINMEYYVPEDGGVKAEIYDNECRVLATFEDISKGGNKIMSLDISHLPPGVYMCVLRFRGAMEGVKFLKI